MTPAPTKGSVHRLADALGGGMSQERAGRLVRHLPRSVLRAIAPRIAAPSELGPVAGWTFDWAYGIEPTGSYRLRRAIWDRFHESGEVLAARVPWVLGLRVELNIGNDLSWPLFVGGCIEPNEMTVLASALHPGDTFVDVGANEGLYSLLASRRVGAEGKVVAIEPSSREAGRLRHNIRLNDARRITVIEAALGDREGRAPLHVAEVLHAGQNSLGGFAYPDVAEAGVQQVDVMTLDALARREGLDMVDAIKIDVEGAEESVLDGGRETIERSKPLLLIEVLDEALSLQGSSAARVLDRLASFGYSVLTFDEGTGTPRSLRDHEVPKGNVVAVHRERSLEHRWEPME